MKRLTEKEKENKKLKLDIIKKSRYKISDICKKYGICIESIYKLKTTNFKYDLVLKDVYKKNLEINSDIERIVFNHEEDSL